MIAATTGLGVGLVASAALLGLRHGVDWDHIAAITDLSATQDSPRRGILLGLLYAAGHGVVVLGLGLAVILAGQSLPESIDAVFGRIVGWTLILLGLYVLWSIYVHRDGFRMQSRWMMVIGGVRRLVSKLRKAPNVEHDHEHAAHDEVHHGGDGIHAAIGAGMRHRHLHRHGSGDLSTEYSNSASVAVGMLHGVGAETPTQVVTFLAASQAGGTVAGVVVLVTFLIGLLVSNTAITVASAYGFGRARTGSPAYLALGGITAAVSLVIGILFAMGQDAVLPAIFAG